MLIYLDTETDGLKKPISLLSISIRVNGAMSTFYAMPPGDAECGTKYNNWLTRAKLESIGARPFPEMWTHLKESIPMIFRGDVTVIAHNAKFDMGVVYGECDRAGIERPQWKWADSVPWFRDILPPGPMIPPGKNRPSYALGNVHMHLFGIPIENAHDSEADTEAMFRCIEAVGHPADWSSYLCFEKVK